MKTDTPTICCIMFLQPPTETEIIEEAKAFPNGTAYLYRDKLGDLRLYPKRNNKHCTFIRKVTA